MATVLDCPTPAPPRQRSLSAAMDQVVSPPPEWVSDDWDETDEPEGPFPWGRLVFMGLGLGLGVGLPLIPFSVPILTAFTAAAGALGCPFHPLPADFR